MKTYPEKALSSLGVIFILGILIIGYLLFTSLGGDSEGILSFLKSLLLIKF